MYRLRVIPCLTIIGKKLVKTRRFSNPVYIGDPINAVRIFNDKYADELILLDIRASLSGSSVNFSLVKDIAGEAFMPLAYGGGIKTMNDISSLFEIGIEKVVINTALHNSPDLLIKASTRYGNQSIIAAVDVRKGLFGKYTVYVKSGKINTHEEPLEYIRKAIESGAGEIFLNSIDNDGKMKGFDLELIKSITDNIDVPLIACGGAGMKEDFYRAISEGGASAAAAGSYFVFNGPLKAVLISYPEENEITKLALPQK